jgi:prophage DNA circulation protein
VPTPPAAVAPGGDVKAPAAADPRDAVSLLLAANSKLSAPASTPAAVSGLPVAMQAMIMGQTLSAASDIVYNSQQDAIAVRDSILAALDAVIISAANAAGLDPANVASTWRALVSSRSAFLADINAQIGRLPPVVTIELPSSMPAWLVAYYLADGVPANVRPQYFDLVARNKIMHPAIVPAGSIEALA